MQMWLHERIMLFYAKLRLLPADRLPKKVFDATWTCQGRAVCLPWQRYVNGLLCKYGVTFGATISDYSACVSLVKKRVKSVWHEDLTLITPLEKIILKRYVNWVNPTLVDKLSLKSCSPYLQFLPPSYGVELLLRVRLSCLPVHAHTVGFQLPDTERHSRSQVRLVTSVCPVLHISCLSARDRRA